MKRRVKNTFSLTALLLILWACNKPVYKYNPDFEGKWRKKRSEQNIQILEKW